jgi:hypothetical protein
MTATVSCVFKVGLTLFFCGLVFANPTLSNDEQLAQEAFAKRDYTRSFELFSKLADQGNGAGHFNKGQQLLNGLGVTTDPVRAMESFVSASQLGVAKAKTQVGVMYLDGRGVSKNSQLAIRWLSEAAEGGDLEASFYLARMHLKGDGIARDASLALSELRKIVDRKSRTEEWISLASASVELWMVGAKVPRSDALSQLTLTEFDLREFNPKNEAVTLVRERALALEEEVKKLLKERVDAERRTAEALMLAEQNVANLTALDRERTLALEEEVRKLLKERVDAERRTAEALKLAEQNAANLTVQNAVPKIELVQKPPALQYLDVHALVIGNGAYVGSARLTNPVNDAKVVSAKFREFGFSVTQLLDTDRKQMVQGLASFSKSAISADIAILFYAGHGVQLFGTNYLLPTDVDINDVAQASVQSISLNMILEQYLPGKTRLVFLDACRDNPLNRSNTRGVSRGLAPISVAEGTLISYSTRDGGVAIDGEGDSNSPFVKALVNNLSKDEDIAVILRRVRQSVMAATNNRQTPWEYGSLTGESLILANIRPKREGKK